MEEVTPDVPPVETPEPVLPDPPVEPPVGPGSPGFPEPMPVDQFKQIVREYIMQFSYDKFVDRLYQSGLDETYKAKVLEDMQYDLGLIILQSMGITDVQKRIIESLYIQKDKIPKEDLAAIEDKIAIIGARTDLNIEAAEVIQ